MICFMMNPSRKHIWASREEINMDHVVITIARQYGSGGRTVGKMLAERLESLFMINRSFIWHLMKVGLM